MKTKHERKSTKFSVGETVCPTVATDLTKHLYNLMAQTIEKSHSRFVSFIRLGTGCNNLLSRVLVTVDGVWIGNWIY
jgi:hypothetical protein